MFKKYNDTKDLFYFHQREQDFIEIKKPVAGIYNIVIIASMFSETLSLVPFTFKEKLIEPASNDYREIYNAILEIFDDKNIEVYKDLEILNKIGIMLYGIPGTGKTSMALYIADRICKETNAICLIGKDHNFDQIIDSIRETDLDRKIILFVDEFDKVVTRSYKEKNLFLDFLDGTRTRNNVATIVCLNKYNDIPYEFKNRPSRFKIEKNITYCDSKLIELFIKNKIPDKYQKQFDVAEVSYKLSESQYTIDQIKAIIIDLVVSKLDIDVLIEKHKKTPTKIEEED